MDWHLFEVNAHAAVRWSNKKATAAADKQEFKSFVIRRFLLLHLNSVFSGFCSAYWGLM